MSVDVVNDPDAQIVKVDDHTVDFLLKTPNPLLINEWESWGIFSKSWSEAHGAPPVRRRGRTW